MYDRVYRFNAELQNGAKVSAFQSFPIYDDKLVLVGAFTLSQHLTIMGFISGAGHPAGLAISLGDAFYFTPVTGDGGEVNSGLVSEHAMSSSSIKVKYTEEESHEQK